MSARRRWHDLPPELLAVVSGRLHDAADYVRFHATCTPWRESLPSSAALRPSFFPWLVAPSIRRPLDLKLRCVFSKTSYRAVVPARFSGHNWVARADGTASWFFSASPEPALVDPLTGHATALPPLLRDDGEIEWGMESFPGVMYGDGTVFLYNFLHDLGQWELHSDEETESSMYFRAAILRPGDTTWQIMNRYLYICMAEEKFLNNHFMAAYRVHDGKTLLHVDTEHCVDPWGLLPPPDHCVHANVESEDEDEMACQWQIPEDEPLTADSDLESSHVLESRGELLRVSVIQEFIRLPVAEHRVCVPLAVVVHALEEEVDAGGGSGHTVRWVRRDGRSFSDRVMFLGFPTSFAVEASRFRGGVDGDGDVSGGWVYFLQRSFIGGVDSNSLHGVYAYNLVDGKAKFVERLPLELVNRKNKTFMWLMPQPSIAPIQVIRERLESPKKKGDPTLKFSISRMEKPPKHSKEPFISLNMWNLPPHVDSSWLGLFFNRYGKVSNAEMTSPGKGWVTMVMATSYTSYEVEDAFDGMVLYGRYTLDVSETVITTGELCVASYVE